MGRGVSQAYALTIAFKTRLNIKQNLAHFPYKCVNREKKATHFPAIIEATNWRGRTLVIELAGNYSVNWIKTRESHELIAT